MITLLLFSTLICVLLITHGAQVTLIIYQNNLFGLVGYLKI